MVEELVRRARRRYVINEGLSQASFALAVAIAGFVLLLVAGTRFLQWWTLVVFAAAGVGAPPDMVRLLAISADCGIEFVPPL